MGLEEGKDFVVISTLEELADQPIGMFYILDHHYPTAGAPMVKESKQKFNAETAIRMIRKKINSVAKFIIYTKGVKPSSGFQKLEGYNNIPIIDQLGNSTKVVLEKYCDMVAKE